MANVVVKTPDDPMACVSHRDRRMAVSLSATSRNSSRSVMGIAVRYIHRMIVVVIRPMQDARNISVSRKAHKIMNMVASVPSADLARRTLRSVAVRSSMHRRTVRVEISGITKGRA